MTEVSFNVYSVNEILYFGIWLHCIHLEFLTLLGTRHPIEQCGNVHPFFLFFFLNVNIVYEESW